MNSPGQMFFGKHKFMDKTFVNVIAANEDDCRIKTSSIHGPTTYCDDYECLHRKTCSYYNYDTDKAVAEEPEVVDHNGDPIPNVGNAHIEASVIEEERSDEEILAEYARIASEGENIHGGELDDHDGEPDPMSTPVEETTIEEQMIIWASHRGGAINIANNERNENG